MFACECWTFTCMKMCGSMDNIHAKPLQPPHSLLPSLWSWARQTFPGSPHASRPACCGKSPGAWWPSPPPRWLTAAPGCMKKMDAHGGPGPNTLETHMRAWTPLTDWPNQTFTLASVWLYPPWAWQKVQGRWRGLVGLIYWQPHRKLQPDRLSHDTAPPQLATPTAGHHSWRVGWNGKRETGNNIF